MTTIRLLFEVAVERLEKGALDSAEILLTQILGQVPEHYEAMHQMARIAVKLRDFERAAELLGQVSNAMGDNPDVLVTLGKAYLGLAQVENAIACLERATVLKPTYSRAYRVLSEAFLAMRQLDKAVSLGLKAAHLDPNDAKAFAAYGDALLESRQAEDALEAYKHSLSLYTDNWRVFANRGMALLLLGRLKEAKASLSFANALNPMQPEVVLPLSGVLIDLAEYQEADFLLQKLSAMMPLNIKVLTYLGISAYKQGDSQAAVGAFFKARAMNENDLSLCLRIGDALTKESLVDKALEIYDQALERDPSFVAAYAQKAETLLLKGDFEAGYDVIEAMQEHVDYSFDASLWDGGDVEGKTIFLYSQFGKDALNILIRYAGVLRERGATVFVQATAPSKALIASVAGVDTCFVPGDEIPVIDFHCPVERLPYLIGKSPSELKQPDVYFSPDAERIEKWRLLFNGEHRKKVGIMWQKEMDSFFDIYRTVPLNAFAPIAALDTIRLFSVQTSSGVNALESVDFKSDIQHEPEIENAPLAERLAFIKNLDLLISSDTLTAQVAAGAGVPVWILLGNGPAWFYGSNGNYSPWLPSARLFRQSRIGQWEDVIAAVVNCLKHEDLNG